MSDRIKRFEKSGLMGCFDGTGVTSENYKEILDGPKWITPVNEDPSTWWPANNRVLSCDKNGWILIVMLTESGFELDDGSEAGDTPIKWMYLPDSSQ